MNVMMTGGGTLGPVTPLLAVVEAWREIDPTTSFVWVGTPHGPERLLVEQHQIPFFSLSAPKLDRHAPARWLFIPIKLPWSLWRANALVTAGRPEVVVTAGGYVSIPLVWIARLRGVPVWVHQQDVRPGLANKLMAVVASGISVAWPHLQKFFPPQKTRYIGNPVRPSLLRGSAARAAERFGLRLTKPTVMVFGGGTGAEWINQAVARIVSELTRRANVLHITGRGKHMEVDARDGYKQVELVSQGMNDIYALADLVVCRAGMGTISELSALQKAAIIIPIPGTHQEDNSKRLLETKAAMVLDQSSASPQVLLQTINRLLDDELERQNLGARLQAALPTRGVAERLVEEIRIIVKKKKT